MKKTSEVQQRQQNSIRNYLLGTLDDKGAMRRIEESLLLDDDFAERLSMAEDELIDEYLDETLNDLEYERFLQFFLASPENKQKLQLVTSLRKYAAQSSKKTVRKKLRFFNWRSLYAPPPALRWVMTALVLGGFAFAVWRIGFYESGISQGITELHAGYRSARPFESRLSDFDYAPFSNMRGGDISSDQATVEALARDRAARKLLDAAREEPGAKAFHALGNYYLTERQLEKAVAQYDAALRIDPNNARLYNDYGVALVEKAGQTPPEERTGERAKNFARAFEYFTKAVELDESLLEARFNKAITLQKLNSPEQAKKAWRDYLEKDSSSPYADEARTNLQRLETETSSVKTPERVLTDFFEVFERGDEEKAWLIVSQTREMITSTMIFFQLARKFLEASDAAQTGSAEKYLAALRFAGKLEKERAGDPYFAELAEFYASTDQPTRRNLAQAQTFVEKGYLLTQDSKYSEAITVFERTKNTFDEVGNIWESKLSEYWLGFLQDRIGNAEQSASKFLALEDYSEEKKYKWLRAQPLNCLAESAFGKNEYSKAIDYLNVALAITEENADTYNRQKLLARLGGYYSYLGDVQRALIQVEKISGTKPSYFSSDRQSWRNCLFAAETFHKLKLSATAISFGREALLLGRERITESTANHTSYYTLAALYGEAGKYSEAIDYARQSLDSIQTVGEEDKRLLRNYSLLQTAHLYRQKGDCGEALEIYSTIIEETASRHDALQLELNNYEAHKGRLLCYFRSNRANLIEEELIVVLGLYEKFRSQIREEQIRNAFFDNEQSVYDLAVDFERSRNDFQTAFETAEKSKARSLLDLFQTKTGIEKTEKESSRLLNRVVEPLSLEEIQKRLPERVQIVQYAVLPDKILIWIITRTRFQAIEKKIPSIEVGEQIENYLKVVVESKSAKIDDAAALWLYEALVAPVLPFLDPHQEICIVPDKMLYRLPFAALASPANSRYLIEDFAVFYAPSATMLILSSEIAAQKLEGAAEKILSVGNPRFNRREFPNLPDLPDSEDEAVKIASYYSFAETLTGKIADKKTVLKGLAESSVFHFAGHYAVNDSFPGRSKLLLAARTTEADADGVEMREVLEQNLVSVKLAVLSACRTGTESYLSGEGMMGIARGFLAGGVPLVVASQWAVDSDATAELMVKFHFYRKQGGLSSGNALRRAQLEMLGGANQRFRLPYYWAGFLPIGGYTDY